MSYTTTQLHCTKAFTLNTKLICMNSFVHIIIDRLVNTSILFSFTAVGEFNNVKYFR